MERLIVNLNLGILRCISRHNLCCLWPVRALRNCGAGLEIVRDNARQTALQLSWRQPHVSRYLLAAGAQPPREREVPKDRYEFLKTLKQAPRRQYWKK